MNNLKESDNSSWVVKSRTFWITRRCRLYPSKVVSVSVNVWRGLTLCNVNICKKKYGHTLNLMRFEMLDEVFVDFDESLL